MGGDGRWAARRRGSAMGGLSQIPLGQLATIKQVAGPMVVRTEGAMPTAWVYVDVGGRDIGSYVREAQRMVSDVVTLPPGYTHRVERPVRVHAARDGEA